MQEPCENRFCSLLLFEAREINRFLEIYHRDPRKILRASRNSILETRASNLETRFSIGSRIEFRVETVNLHLHGTVSTHVQRNVLIRSSLHLFRMEWHAMKFYAEKLSNILQYSQKDPNVQYFVHGVMYTFMG